MVVAFEPLKETLLTAAGLLHAAVEVEVDLPAARGLPLDVRVSVQDVYEYSVVRAQLAVLVARREEG